MFQFFANDTEIRRRFPTCFQLAAARHAMTFTTDLHIICNCLLTQKYQRKSIDFGELKWIITIRPTWLLCKLILECMSPARSRASKNSSENAMPKFILCEHPPHFHLLAAFNLYSVERSISWVMRIKILQSCRLTAQFCSPRLDCRSPTAWALVCHLLSRLHHSHHRCAKFLSNYDG